MAVRFQKTKVEFKRNSVENTEKEKDRRKELWTVGAGGVAFQDLGGEREAGKVETGEEIPDTLATRGRCCPIKGPGAG